jgi:hypothetical protein
MLYSKIIQNVYIHPPQCPSDTATSKVDLYASTSDIPPYKHCTKCNLGAMFGEEGYEKCTYCGSSEHTLYSSSGE